MSFGEHSEEDSDDQDIESLATQATLFNWQADTTGSAFGVAASADLTKRLLQKMEFGTMMRAQ